VRGDGAEVYSGTSGFRGLAPCSAIPDFPDPDAVQFWMGPDAHLLHYAVGDTINFLAVLEGPEKEADGSVDPAADGELVAASRDCQTQPRRLAGRHRHEHQRGLLFGLFRPDLDDPTEEDVLPVYRTLNAVPFLVSDEALRHRGRLPVDAGYAVK
jgi:hypothetical protein